MNILEPGQYIFDDGIASLSIYHHGTYLVDPGTLVLSCLTIVSKRLLCYTFFIRLISPRLMAFIFSSSLL